MNSLREALLPPIYQIIFSPSALSNHPTQPLSLSLFLSLVTTVPLLHISGDWQLPQMEVYWLPGDWQVCLPPP